MARARSASGRAAAEITEITQDQGEVVQGGADGGMLGPVGGFGDGQRAFGQRAGRGRDHRDRCRIQARVFRRMPTAGCSGP